MELISWNVNGIRAIDKKGFLGWVEDRKPDILSVQETKAQDDQIPEHLANISGYNFYVSSAVKKGYSGVAVWSKIKPLKVSKGFDIQIFDDEGRILVLEYKDFVLLNIYFPNGKMNDIRLQYKLDFYDAFLKFCAIQTKPLVICGDVNTAHNEIDLARPEANIKISGFLREERDWLDRFLDQNLIDTYRTLYPDKVKYTWWSMRSGARSRNVGWRIDYFYVSTVLECKLKSAFILNEVMGSDHCPLGINIDL